MYLDSIYIIHAWEVLRKAAATKTGPNDAKRVVWAIVSLFLYLFRVFLLLNVVFSFIYALHVRGGSGKAAMTITGPNDAFCVVWAIK
jgi:hypothetical protein